MNKYQYKVKGVDYEVEIAEVEGNIAKVIFDTYFATATENDTVTAENVLN